LHELLSQTEKAAASTASLDAALEYASIRYFAEAKIIYESGHFLVAYVSSPPRFSTLAYPSQLFMAEGLGQTPPRMNPTQPGEVVSANSASRANGWSES
jgi:hypothetical protein